MTPETRRIVGTVAQVDEILHRNGLSVKESVVVLCILLVKAQPLSEVSREKFLTDITGFINDQLTDGRLN